jgi:hypothetical protein
MRVSLIIVTAFVAGAATTAAVFRFLSPPISSERTEAQALKGSPISLQRVEALKALKGLRSATSGPLAYRDYAPRVTEAKIVLDRYLEEPERGDGQARTAMRQAFDLYALAVSAWRAESTMKAADSKELASDSRVELCPALFARVAAPPANDPYKDIPDPIVRRGATIAFNVGMIWVCAADKIDEAERLGR